MAFCGVSLPAALNRIKIMHRARLAITTFHRFFNRRPLLELALIKHQPLSTSLSLTFPSVTVTSPRGSFAGVPAASTSVLR